MSSNNQKISPFLWFDGNAEEAINLYTSIFKDSKIVSIARYGNEFPGMAGKVLTAVFELNGQQFMAIDGGPMYKFTEAISFQVNCETQEDIDDKWNKLTANGGSESRCGWLKDKFGLSWQIVTPVLGQLLQDKDPEKAQRVMQAMMQMKKIIIKDLQDAHAG